MTGLLPHVVRHAIEHRSVYGASTSYGLIALVLLLGRLAEWDASGSVAHRPRRSLLFAAVTAPRAVAASPRGPRLRLRM